MTDIKVVHLTNPEIIWGREVTGLLARIVHIIDLSDEHLNWLCSSSAPAAPFWGLAVQTRVDRLAVISVCLGGCVLHVMVPKTPPRFAMPAVC